MGSFFGVDPAGILPGVFIRTVENRDASTVKVDDPVDRDPRGGVKPKLVATIGTLGMMTHLGD